ncbi:MAG: 2-amino-4-hydroxy-6-hydroxymethyldihydropteridine diphosphokinase, partial [Aeromonas veronii]
MTEVFIAIGSNLSDPLGQARRAVAALARLP